jgi:hypothetical protein
LLYFIDNDLDAENSKALSLILVFTINCKFYKYGGCAEISNVRISSLLIEYIISNLIAVFYLFIDDELDVENRKVVTVIVISK